MQRSYDSSLLFIEFYTFCFKWKQKGRIMEKMKKKHRGNIMCFGNFILNFHKKYTHSLYRDFILCLIRQLQFFNVNIFPSVIEIFRHSKSLDKKIDIFSFFFPFRTRYKVIRIINRPVSGSKCVSHINLSK